MLLVDLIGQLPLQPLKGKMSFKNQVANKCLSLLLTHPRSLEGKEYQYPVCHFYAFYLLSAFLST